MEKRIGGTVTPIASPREGTERSQIIVTCTPSRTPILARTDVMPGTVIAAVGADSADKQALDPTILRDASVIRDLTRQCAAVGERHHAIDAGLMTVGDVRAELADVVVNRPAALVYEGATQSRVGKRVHLFDEVRAPKRSV